MAWTFEVTGKRREGFRPVAVIRYTDGINSEIENWPGASSDEAIAEHAALRIMELDAADAQLDSITVKAATAPDPKAEEYAAALNELTVATLKASRRKQIADLNDPAVTAAAARLDAAEAKLKD